jgi:hypothetical protein
MTLAPIEVEILFRFSGGNLKRLQRKAGHEFLKEGTGETNSSKKKILTLLSGFWYIK